MVTVLQKELIFDPVAHQFFVRGREVPSVTRILKAGGFINYGPQTELYDSEAMRRGKAVHSLCEEYDLKGKINFDWLNAADEHFNYVQAWASFRDATGYEPQKRYIEAAGYDKSRWFAGIPDRGMGYFKRAYFKDIPPKARVLIDIKTGEVDPFTALQTAGYATIVDRAVVRMAVQLKSDGLWKPHFFTDVHDYNVFYSAVATYHWRAAHGKLRN